MVTIKVTNDQRHSIRYALLELSNKRMEQYINTIVVATPSHTSPYAEGLKKHSKELRNLADQISDLKDEKQ